MNIDNIRAWTTALRSGDFAQTREKLVSYDAKTGTEAFCCLGVACVLAGVERTNDGEFDGQAGLAPWSLVEWVGLDSAVTDSSEWDESFDLRIDWPEDLCARDSTHPGTDAIPMRRDARTWSAASLNDACNLTFEQIADVVDYFGLSEAAAG